MPEHELKLTSYSWIVVEGNREIEYATDEEYYESLEDDRDSVESNTEKN